MHHRVLLLLCAEFFLEGDAQFYLVHAAYLYQLTRFVCCIYGTLLELHGLCCCAGSYALFCLAAGA